MGQSCSGFTCTTDPYNASCLSATSAWCAQNVGTSAGQQQLVGRNTVSDSENFKNKDEVYSLPDVKYHNDKQQADELLNSDAIKSHNLGDHLDSLNNKRQGGSFLMNSHKVADKLNGNYSGNETFSFNGGGQNTQQRNSYVASDNNTQQLQYSDLDLIYVPDIVLPDGSKYQGQMLKRGNDLVKCGKGIQLWKDGAKYEGEWRDNKANGRGIFYHVNGDLYEGEFRDDQANGQGVYYHKNGSKYQGAWKNDLKDGFGREDWDDGAFYEGYFKEGKKHGQGTYRWVDGNIYTGSWIQNNIEGQGRYDWLDGRRYEGQWKENKLHGRGIYTWADGRRYEGQYFDDKKEGFGIYSWPDGRRYEGQWKNGKQDGEGKFVNTKGKSKTGLWEDGNRVKWLEKKSNNRSSMAQRSTSGVGGVATGGGGILSTENESIARNIF